LGCPGSGKGTHGQVIADTLRLKHISTGDYFRSEIASHTPLGVLAATYINRGQLVPDTVATQLLAQILSRLEPQQGFILDGYPRSRPQADDLRQLLAQQHRALTAVFYLKVSDEEIMRRLSGRLTCRLCQKTFHQIFDPPLQPNICPACGGELYQRDDDKPKTIEKRLQVFHALTEPLITFYREQGVLHEIDAEGRMDVVRALVKAAAQTLLAD
jgi:adenylate kinase